MMSRRLLTLLCCLCAASVELPAQSVVLRTVGAGSDAGAGSAYWEQAVQSGSGAIGTGTVLERVAAGSTHELGVGTGDLTVLSVRSTWHDLAHIDSLVLGDVHITAPLRGALPGAVLGRRSIVGVMVALPAWPGASSRLTLGSAPERGHAGGVSGVAAGSRRPVGHALRSADFGEPDCVAGPGWSCAVMALALTQRLPRSARLTTSTSLTTDLASGGGLADAQLLLDGGKHVIQGATLQPGAALHVGRASGLSAWSGVQGRTAGMHVRASRGTVLRPSVRWSGGAAEADGSGAPSSEPGRPWQGSWDARRATEGNVDAWWSPRSWLRASAGFRSWTERAAGSADGGAIAPEDLLDEDAGQGSLQPLGWITEGATRGHHAGMGVFVVRGRWQASAGSAWWGHQRSGQEAAPHAVETSGGGQPIADDRVEGHDLSLAVARSEAAGGVWRASLTTSRTALGRRSRVLVRREQPIGLRGTFSAGSIVRSDVAGGALWAPTGQLRWRLPYGHVSVETQLPLGSGPQSRAERWVGGTAELQVGRWVASVSTVQSAAGPSWRLTARRTWRSLGAGSQGGYERATRGAWWVHGRVLTTRGEPLIALPMLVGDVTAFTDDDGRFSVRVDSPDPVFARPDFDGYPGGRGYVIASAPDAIAPTRNAIPQAAVEYLWRLDRH